MKCEVAYCIYNRDFKCLLSKTTINPLGMCEECMIISLDPAFLETEKKRQRQEIWRESQQKTPE